MALTVYGSPYVDGTDLVSDWPAASLTVAQSIDSAGYYIGRGNNTQTGSYTAVLTDAGKTVTMSNASANTVTIPANSSVAYVVGSRINILNLGAGACTPTAGAGVTISGTIAALTTNKAAAVIKTATNTWSYIPFSSGADAAVVTSTTGSPTITTDGTATVYKFTGDGTLVVGTAGNVVALLVAGAGGGGTAAGAGSRGGGSGGGGGLIYETVALKAATYQIKIGAGGAGGSGGANISGSAGGNSRLGFMNAIGGGGGGGGVAGGGGGSGGGGSNGGGGGAANTDFSQGNAGGGSQAVDSTNGGGGGGAGGAGALSGAGGVGLANSASGASVTYAAGAAQGTTVGSANIGNGGSGGSSTTAYAGGSGVVIVRVG